MNCLNQYNLLFLEMIQLIAPLKLTSFPQTININKIVKTIETDVENFQQQNDVFMQRFKSILGKIRYGELHIIYGLEPNPAYSTIQEFTKVKFIEDISKRLFEMLIDFCKMTSLRFTIENISPQSFYQLEHIKSERVQNINKLTICLENGKIMNMLKLGRSKNFTNITHINFLQADYVLLMKNHTFNFTNYPKLKHLNISSLSSNNRGHIHFSDKLMIDRIIMLPSRT